MPKYVVHLRAVIIREIEVEAETPEEAASAGIGYALRGEFKMGVESVEWDGGMAEFVSRCEACLGVILSTEQGYSYSDDGVHLCTTCTAEAMSEA